MSENKNHPLSIPNKNHSDWLQKLENASGKTLNKEVQHSLHVQNLDMVFIFDATISMAPYIDEVKINLQEIIQEIKTSIPSSQISIIAYADYPSKNAAFLTKVLDLTDKTDVITKFINNIHTTSNDDIPEALEIALADANKLSWRLFSKKALIVVGDAPPHGVIDSILNQTDYRIEVEKLITKEIIIYTVQCGFDSATAQSFKWIADKSKGIFLNLSKIEDLKNILIGASMKEVGLLNGYIKKLKTK